MTRPLIYGYLNRSGAMTEYEVSFYLKSMGRYAVREGYTLDGVFVQQPGWNAGIAFSALLVALQRHNVRHVLVPDLHHLAFEIGLQKAMCKHLEAVAGATVLAISSK